VVWLRRSRPTENFMASNSSKAPPKNEVYEKAIALLARREHSSRELKAKLVQRGFDAEETSQVLDTLVTKDFQNDARFGEMLVRTRIEGGYAARWIIAELRTHGVDEEAAGNLIDAAAPDWLQLALRQLRRRYGSRPARDFAERGKRSGFLLRRGFDPSTVKLAVHAQGSAAVDETD
jgi:regulatory protein